MEFKQKHLSSEPKTPTTDIGGFMGDRGKLKGDNLELEGGGFNSAKIVVGQGADSGGINSAGQGSDIVFWAGATHKNRNNAPFKVDAEGNLTATSVNNIGLLLGTPVTNFAVSNGASGEVVFSATVPANSLGTNKGLRATVVGTAPSSASETSMTMAFVFGGTTFLTTPDLTQATSNFFKIEFVLFNFGSASSQRAYAHLFQTNETDMADTAPITRYNNDMTGSIDTTLAQTFQITASESGDSGGANPTIYYVVVEKLR